MSLESPLKKDVTKALRDLDALQRIYNVYFGGGEEDPPKTQRKQLDDLINKIKTQIASANNASDKFQANGLVSRYQTMAGRWDKMLRAVEAGTLVLPKKRE